jgi:Protein of unknown function (DUF4238)
MPLDHYVSQVHLRKFYSPSLKTLMYATRKSDLQSFCCNSKSVCRIEDGSSNRYMREDRLVEQFLQFVEPQYNEAVANAYKGNFNQRTILSIAGFVAYVLACSPAAMRIFSDPLKAAVEVRGILLDRRGQIPAAPETLGGKSLTELLGDGTIKVKIDPKFPQALGIKSIIGWVSVFGNSRWDVLHNEESDTPFFTSDFPIGVETTHNPIVLNKIVPLTPNLAVRICPDIQLSRSAPDLSFARFSATRCKLRRQQISEINRCLVRSAEDTIFYRENRDWVVPFIAKNRYYRIEGITRRVPHGRGFLNVSTQRIISTRGKHSPA